MIFVMNIVAKTVQKIKNFRASCPVDSKTVGLLVIAKTNNP